MGAGQRETRRGGRARAARPGDQARRGKARRGGCSGRLAARAAAADFAWKTFRRAPGEAREGQGERTGLRPLASRPRGRAARRAGPPGSAVELGARSPARPGNRYFRAGAPRKRRARTCGLSEVRMPGCTLPPPPFSLLKLEPRVRKPFGH